MLKYLLKKIVDVVNCDLIFFVTPCNILLIFRNINLYQKQGSRPSFPNNERSFEKEVATNVD